MSRRALWLLLCLPLTVLGQSLDAPWTPQRLMQALAAVKTIDAAFREQKEFAMLKTPLVASGVLQYRAPAFVRKQTLQPQREDYEINDGWLTIEAPTTGRRQFYLDNYPPLLALTEAIRATLAGDLRALERHYELELQGQPAAWTLRLRPIDPQITDHIAAIIFRGRDNQVLSMETLDVGGDRSLMTVEPRTPAPSREPRRPGRP